MGLRLGYLDFCRPYTRKQRKQNVSTIFAHQVAFHACLPSGSDRSTYAPDKSVILIAGKPEYPQFEPHVGIKMVQVLGSPLYICGTDIKIF